MEYFEETDLGMVPLTIAEKCIWYLHNLASLGSCTNNAGQCELSVTFDPVHSIRKKSVKLSGYNNNLHRELVQDICILEANFY